MSTIDLNMSSSQNQLLLEPSCRKRMNVKDDRLSNLPDEIIHKIFSYIGIQHAVEASALSSRWRFIWTSMPYLNFSSGDFYSLHKFSKFVNHVLSRRNTGIDLSSVKLDFSGKATHMFVDRILNYAISHNVQQLTVTCSLENDTEFPISLFRSESLKHLSIKKDCCGPRWWKYSLTLASMWELPALTTLHLDRIELSDENSDKCIDLISKCVNLENLTLENCRIMGLNGFSIHHSRLSYLKIEDGDSNVKFVSVVAPQLRNLSISGFSRDILISAPNLSYLLLESYECLNFSADDFRFLEKVDICIRNPYKEDPDRIVCLLQRLHRVKFLTLNIEILEHLSSYVELISHQPSPFANLKSLKIYRERVYMYDLPNENVDVSTEVKSYLLDSSPSATFTTVSREDIVALKNATSAQVLVAKLRLLLKQEKANTKAKKAYMELGKAAVVCHIGKMHEQGKSQRGMKLQQQIRENMANMKSYWSDLSVEIERKKEKACLIIPKLEDIKELLAKLPASKRAMIQPCFSSLCAEVGFEI